MTVTLGVPKEKPNIAAHFALFLSGRTLKGCMLGGFKPKSDLPEIVNLYLDGVTAEPQKFLLVYLQFLPHCFHVFINVVLLLMQRGEFFFKLKILIFCRTSWWMSLLRIICRLKKSIKLSV